MKKQNILAVIRARMGSTRLPKKMLLEIIDGKSSLELMVERVMSCKSIGKVVVATTTNREDKAIVDLCKKIGVNSFRGSEEDVLDRCFQATLENTPADAVVILTGDCTLFDHKVADRVIQYFLDNEGLDYVANNNIPTTYPDGMDVEICSYHTLQTIWMSAETDAEKEHITFYLQQNKDDFKTKNLEYKEDLSDKGWCLDTKEDLEFIRRIYKELYHDNLDFGMKEILDLLDRKPEIEKINGGMPRNEWRDKSIEEDKDWL
jgi:spore coat polysaccharide biosynthesis protein SpsF